MEQPDEREDPRGQEPCPPWCVTSASDHLRDAPGVRVHEGPRFNMVRTWWVEGSDGGYSASLSAVPGRDTDLPPGAELSVEDLRRLATDALDAALWIDRQLASGPRTTGRSLVDLVREAHERGHRSA